jgi:hypothetical protein
MIPEGWITRILGEKPKVVNTVPREGKEPSITYFEDKIIYLPGEQELYEQQVLKKDALWLGVTGWTTVPKHCAELYGTSTESNIYETLVTALIVESAVALKKEGIDVDLRHGASDVGVDAGSLRAMEVLGLSGSGVNCPKFMPYVKDDRRGGPVLVAVDKEQYHKLFADYNRVLLVTGGRDDAFHHDYLSRLRSVGYSVCADVMQTATVMPIRGVDHAPEEPKERMHNAAAYIREKNSFSYTPLPRSYEALLASTKLTLLSHAYTLLEHAPNPSLLTALEDEFLAEHRRGPTMMTVGELEQRISRAKDDFSRLV